MGTATVQLNTRIDPMLKAGGDAVLTRNGLGPSDAIRALWAYLVEHQTLPGFMVADKREASRAESLAEQGGQVEALQALMNIFMDADAAADVLGQATPQGMVDAIRRHF